MSLALIVGSGRSGTHMLAKMLATSSECDVTLEIEPLFSFALEHCRTESTVSGDAVMSELKKLNKKKKLQINKTHTCLYLKDRIDKEIPNSKFIYIERYPQSVVSSMLQHKAISKRLRSGWKTFSFPSRFLGTGDMGLMEYSNLDPCERGALAWKAANSEYQKHKNDDNLLYVSYDDLVMNPELVMSRICDFLGINENFNYLKPDKSRLYKYRELLTEDEKSRIDKIVNS